LSNIRTNFPFVVSYKIPDEVNEIVLAARQKSMVAVEDASSVKKKFEPTVKAFKKINQVKKHSNFH
jgi:DNA-binding protein